VISDENIKILNHTKFKDQLLTGTRTFQIDHICQQVLLTV